MNHSPVGSWLGGALFEFAAIWSAYRGIKYGFVLRSVKIGLPPDDKDIGKSWSIAYGVFAVLLALLLVGVGWRFFVTTSQGQFMR